MPDSSSSSNPCLQLIQFDVKITAPTQGQIMHIPVTGQTGPPAEGTIHYKVKWVCPDQEPPAIVLKWKFVLNANDVPFVTVEVPWVNHGTYSEGEVDLTPSRTVEYTPALNEGPNTWMLDATALDVPREDTITFQIVVDRPSSSAPVPSS